MSDEVYKGPGETDDLSLCEKSDIFYLLSHHRKRAVILTLAMAPWSHVHLRQLAEIIAALEADTEQRGVSTQQVTNVRTNLKRSHLEPLCTAGLIKWKSDCDDRLEPGPGFSRAMRTLMAGGYSLSQSPSTAEETE
ncbi:DUF7344 domain-containing protein [Haloferax larsenii]|uniref:DUF7344 domain-containing protein n=1 Tax=Haloferax larsenii TaxID=302484 RepID=A0A1H7VGA2_HALLR|nr:hypothetical protein [Haloferax larsenii]SEM08312.1 hypothetical protein SAMN04488691_1243 [Haloferax larsenii]